MKKILMPLSLLLIFACNNNQDKKDSVEAAEDKNEQKTEQKVDTVATERQMDNDNEFVVKAASLKKPPRMPKTRMSGLLQPSIFLS